MAFDVNSQVSSVTQVLTLVYKGVAVTHAGVFEFCQTDSREREGGPLGVENFKRVDPRCGRGLALVAPS